jgi:tRNA 5-methylaminomethyl-2-thiouridine biosynthesis bifunctional protein
LPSHDGTAVVGATYDLDRTDTTADAESHAQNLARAEHMLPGSTAGVGPGHVIGGGVGMRCVAQDRMPMLWAMVDVAAARERAPMLTGAHLSDLPRIPGLYGAFAFASRGLTWTLLAGELLAAQLHGEPLPVEGAIADAMDPGRFILYRLRRGTL